MVRLLNPWLLVGFSSTVAYRSMEIKKRNNSSTSKSTCVDLSYFLHFFWGAFTIFIPTQLYHRRLQSPHPCKKSEFWTFDFRHPDPLNNITLYDTCKPLYLAHSFRLLRPLGIWWNIKHKRHKLARAKVNRIMEIPNKVGLVPVWWKIPCGNMRCPGRTILRKQTQFFCFGNRNRMRHKKCCIFHSCCFFLEAESSYPTSLWIMSMFGGSRPPWLAPFGGRSDSRTNQIWCPRVGIPQKDTKLNHSLSLYTQQWSSIVTPDNLLWNHHLI